ncbi:MJ1255/VC2487 family glycosyltransferase [Aliikangiella maris]|uniref:MJ1255/VC2487 family glycosyltransferase n=2 Tax=Aliikangiella maris TaxID=3162458 RepID=A0ABV2BT15_9GAMM
MKILYGVQATGNGHTTRARMMAEAFQQLNIEVDWVFSGRDKKDMFDMEIFEDYQLFPGLTLAIDNGSLNYFKTAFKNNIAQFIRDVYHFDTHRYDLIINDFEPITAWSAKRQGRKVIGLSHQNSFSANIPRAGSNLLAETILKYFAPTTTGIGLHWDHFDDNVLPPIIAPYTEKTRLSEHHIQVYYPFCAAEKLIDWFAPFKNYQFHIFHGENTDTGYEHIKLYHFSRKNFQKLQTQCAGVITAAGFALCSEALQIGQKLLLIPLARQMEQLSNALALKQMQRATLINQFSNQELEKWLQQPIHQPVNYPNVALEVAKWLVNSEKESLKNLSKRLWQETKASVDNTSAVLPFTANHALKMSGENVN